jgi:hypothetical protein|nr:MAG TPA: hypothetical protein [Caudoviricetes sp.]
MPITLTDVNGIERTFRVSASAIARYEKECRARGEKYSLMSDLSGDDISFETLDRLCTFIGVESYEAWLDMGFGIEELLSKIWGDSAMKDLGFSSGARSSQVSSHQDVPESETA